MTSFIDIHTHKTELGNNIEICNISCDTRGSYKYYSCGLHPWDIEKSNIDERIAKLYCYADGMIALGEIGLDRSIDCNVSKQISIFEKQNEIAVKYNLPVIIHSVKAYSDFLELINNKKNKTPWIFHGYNGNLDIALALINKGCYISFGCNLLNSKKLQYVFLNVSLDSVFFETDNSAVTIEEIYNKSAVLLDVSIDVLKEKMYSNFKKIFN